MRLRAAVKVVTVPCITVLLSIGVGRLEVEARSQTGSEAGSQTDSQASQRASPQAGGQAGPQPSQAPREALAGGEVASLLGWAAKLGGYMKPTGRPHVYPITADEIRRGVCLNFACSAVAFFNPATDTIYVDDRLRLREDVVAQSYLVHEMVHYLQHVTGKIGESASVQSCEERMALEIEAYRVQNRFLAAMGSIERVMGASLLARLC